MGDCTVCFKEYNEETCVPKVLHCGHSLCAKCLSIIFQRKSCPKCRGTLSQEIGDYPTNFDLLGFIAELKEKEANSLVSRTLESIDREKPAETSVIRSMKNNKASVNSKVSFQEFPVRNTEAFINLAETEDRLKSMSNSYIFNQNLIIFNDYLTPEDFLKELALLLQGGRRIYACTKIGDHSFTNTYTNAYTNMDDLGKWKYGEITFWQNRLHIQCLSSSVFEPGAHLVAFKDLGKYAKKDALLFLEFGSQKLFFTLTVDASLDNFRAIRYFTREDGYSIKGLDSRLYKDQYDAWNRCDIIIPPQQQIHSKTNYLGCQRVVKKGEVILTCGGDYASIEKTTKDQNVFNLLGKLHGNCEIDFNKLNLESKITDCGISLQL